MPRSTPAQARRRLAPLLLALTAGVGLVHALAWDHVSARLAHEPPAAPRAAMQVRTLTPPPPVHVAQVTPTAAQATPTVAPPTAVAPPAPPRPVAPVVEAHVDVAAPAPEADPEPAAAAARTDDAPVVVIEADPVLVATASTLATLDAAATLVPVARGEVAQDEVPVYRTKLPPPMTLGYELTYGRWTGRGELLWRPRGNQYEVRLDGRVAGLRVITLASQGGVDAAGLAPVRYTDERRGRGEQAANFQRKAGKITFSGNPAEFPLLQGSQDRLSWMLQLAAIALADPKQVASGARVALHVVGARGESDVWAFHTVGNEEVNTPDGKLKTIKLLREPRKPHDTRVEVWLAPSLHYLPVRAKQTTENSDWDLRLQSSQPPT